MEHVTEMPLVAVWQAEFWPRRDAKSYWIDFPRHVSEALERGRESGRSFVYRLRTGELDEKEGDWSPPAWKRARHEERASVDDAIRYIYLLDTVEMRQTNMYHGCSRRLRRTYIEEGEYERISRWSTDGRKSPESQQVAQEDEAWPDVWTPRASSAWARAG